MSFDARVQRISRLLSLQDSSDRDRELRLRMTLRYRWLEFCSLLRWVHVDPAEVSMIRAFLHRDPEALEPLEEWAE